MINPRSISFVPVTSVQCYQDIVEAVLHFWSAKPIFDLVLIFVLSFSYLESTKIDTQFPTIPAPPNTMVITEVMRAN